MPLQCPNQQLLTTYFYLASASFSKLSLPKLFCSLEVVATPLISLFQVLSNSVITFVF